jgi:hypothetical protein
VTRSFDSVSRIYGYLPNMKEYYSLIGIFQSRHTRALDTTVIAWRLH